MCEGVNECVLISLPVANSGLFSDCYYEFKPYTAREDPGAARENKEIRRRIPE